MRRILTYGLTLIVGFALGAGAAGGSDDDTEPVAAATAEPADRATPTPEPEPAPDPSATAERICDYLLDPYLFVGQAKIRNTGNVGVKVRLVATWQRLGLDAVRAEKTVRVTTGDTRRVKFDVPATVDDIAAHQSAQGECRVKTEIVDTFGALSP